MSLAPAAPAMIIIRPSTCAGAPQIILFDGGPSRIGQFSRTIS
jgi:hypothetical protein